MSNERYSGTHIGTIDGIQGVEGEEKWIERTDDCTDTQMMLRC